MKISGERRIHGGMRKRRRKTELGTKEKRRLFQLACCLVLFFAVFAGRGAFPEQTAEAGKELLTAIQSSVDFKSAFDRLGRALEGREPLTDAVGDFCVTVFGVKEEPKGAAAEGFASVFEEELEFLETVPTSRQMICRRLRLPEDALQEREEEPPPVLPPASETAVPTVGEVIETVSYTGQELPERTTMDHLSLGTVRTVTPVLGTVTSGFGYRDHPVDGENKFHYGIDIAADKGSDIQAFADGTVEFIGDSTSYGLYIQLEHPDGIKSFYAHCDSLAVSKGDCVTAGQKIGEVGNSGNATGTHLHFQLSLNGMSLNPIYYIETG